MAANKTRQEALLELWINNPFATYKEIAEKANIPEQTFYHWRKDESFMKEYHNRIQKRFKEMEHKAMAQLENLIANGEWQAVKYVLDGSGYKPTDKLEVAQTTINVAIDDESD